MIGLKIYNIFSPQIYNLFDLVRVLLILINSRSIQGAHAFFLGIVIKCQDAAGFNRDQNSGVVLAYRL
ncbi:hypothetical protein LOK49_LG13G00711 [Camellia lanceoleosa]|uniref:Uncharacterized protein n=1 Tax=Camellia lanceoleosa TaxID=1840588 RepID=A0ACC0FLV8_9ERIC|nr:hypothetical protein LOK49_LG13G00711 [Camellia lanceoleosa]